MTNHCAAFDVQAVCSGFVYGLSMADSFIKPGMHKKVLVIGAEVFSRILNFEDRTTCVLFGDGAGAVVMSASDEPGMLATRLHADGSHAGILCVPGSVPAPARLPAALSCTWMARPYSSWLLPCLKKSRMKRWTRPACSRPTSTG